MFLAPPALRRPWTGVIAGLLLISTGCQEGAADLPQAVGVARGKALYLTYCVACHHPDPRQQRSDQASHGPPIHGSSLDLLTQRLAGKAYPDGYVPKRKTAIMPAFPNLETGDIASLHAFIDGLAANLAPARSK